MEENRIFDEEPNESSETMTDGEELAVPDKADMGGLPADLDAAMEEFQRIKANCPRIREVLTAICKMEWDKVKIEAGSSKWKQRKINRLQKDVMLVPEHPSQPSAPQENKQPNQA